MAITKITTPDLINLPFNNTDGIVLAKGITTTTIDTTGTCSYPTSALALYQLDNVTETCGNWSNATNVGSATFTPGKFGDALTLTGGQYLTLSDDWTYDNNFSCSVWVYMDSIAMNGNYPSPIYFFSTGSYDWNIELDNAVASPVFNLFCNASTGSQRAGTTTTLAINTWYHIAVTASSAEGKKIYLNGVLQTTNTDTSNLINYWNLDNRIGSSRSSDWDGKIDQLRLFTSVLTQADVTKLYNETNINAAGRPTTNLSDGEFRYNTTTKKVEFYDGAYWFALTSTTAVPQTGTTGACNYPTTATALYQLDNDVINSCNNVGATPVGITYSTTEKKFGTYSAVFSGSSSYITTPIDFSTFTNYSVSMWIYPTANGAGTATGTGFGGTVDAGTDYGFFLSINSSNQIRFYERTGSPVTALTSSNAVTLNTWNNIVAIRDGSTKYIYVNNTVTSLNTNTTITHTSDFIFGRAGLYASDSYTGNIDQARIFPSALTSAQVTALYTETAP